MKTDVPHTETILAANCAARRVIHGYLQGETLDFALNFVGTIVLSVFVAVEFGNPHDALLEFDDFAKFVRSQIAQAKGIYPS